MLSKQHYEAIAEILGKNLQRYAIIEELINYFALDNPRFDKVRFNEAILKHERSK